MTESTISRLDMHVQQNRVQPKGGQNTPHGHGAAVEEGLSGVTAAWLSKIFEMKVDDVKRRLADCPVLRQGKQTNNGIRGRTYSIKEAAPYLVPPKVSPQDFLRAIKKGGMPSTMQQAFWNAMLKQQKWMENAGQLWHTDKIRETLGGTFQTLKFTMQLWEDTLETETGLTDDQRAKLRVLVDGLQQELYDALVMQMANKQTGPQLDDLPALMAAHGGGPEAPVAPEEAILDAEAESLL